MACTALNTDKIVPIHCVNNIVSGCSSIYSISPTATEYKLNNKTYTVSNGNLTTTTTSLPNRSWSDIKSILTNIANNPISCNKDQTATPSVRHSHRSRWLGDFFPCRDVRSPDVRSGKSRRCPNAAPPDRHP